MSINNTLVKKNNTPQYFYIYIYNTYTILYIHMHRVNRLFDRDASRAENKKYV